MRGQTPPPKINRKQLNPARGHEAIEGLECQSGSSVSVLCSGEPSKGLRVSSIAFCKDHPGDNTKDRLEPGRLGARTLIRRKLLNVFLTDNKDT